MVRRWLVFVVPFVVVFTLGLAVVGWQKGWLGAGDRCEEARFVEFEQVDEIAAGTCVRLGGMAHYTGVVEQTVPGSAFRDEEQWYLFGLFPPYETDAQMIEVLVRTQRPPEDLVSYELMTVEGRLVRPTLDKVPFDTEIILGESSDYFFADDLWLIEPDAIEEGLDPRAGPDPAD